MRGACAVLRSRSVPLKTRCLVLLRTVKARMPEDAANSTIRGTQSASRDGTLDALLSAFDTQGRIQSCTTSSGQCQWLFKYHGSMVAKTTPVTLWPEATAVATAVRHTWCGQYTTLKRPSSASHVHIHVPRPARHPTHAMNECDDDSPGEQTDQTLLKRVLHTSSMRHAARLAQSSDVPRAPLQHCMRIARTMSVHAHAPRP